MRHAKRIRKNKRQYAERHAELAEEDSRSGRPDAGLPDHRSSRERKNGSAKKQQHEGLEMIDATEMANRLGVAKYTVEDWARKSRIPAFKLGRWWRFDEAEVMKALKLSGNDLSRAIGRVK